MRIKDARKHSSLFMWLLYVGLQLLGGQNRYAFVWAIMINTPRTVARKCSLWGLYVCAVRLDIENFLKPPVICSVWYFNLGALELCLEGEAHQSTPGRREWILLNCQLVTKLEVMHILQAQVWSCISAHPGLPHQKTKRETNDAWKNSAKPGKLKYDCFEIWLRKKNDRNYYSVLFCDFPLITWSGQSHVTWVCAVHLDSRS